MAQPRFSIIRMYESIYTIWQRLSIMTFCDRFGRGVIELTATVKQWRNR